MSITKRGTRTSNWSATNTTSTNTTTTSYVYTNTILNHKIDTTPKPFNIGFSWGNKSVNIELKNGNDVFKLANAFMEWLDKNEIEYNVKTSKKK